MSAFVKKTDIEMVGESGDYQLSIGEHIVTKDYKTKESCYKAYIVELINGIEKARSSLPYNTGF